MSFFVDVVTEDSFYENLTLGVVKVLENSPCVKNVTVDRRNGCEASAITNWEQRHGCILPEDLRNFYEAIDGFLLLWNLEIAGEEFPVGRMEIGPLSALKRYAPADKDKQSRVTGAESDAETPREPDVNRSSDESTDGPDPSLCKIFELARCSPESKKERVYLVYRAKNVRGEPDIWLHREERDQWYRLADNFTKYFRMMLVHLGLPLWQSCVSAVPLPTWVEQVYYLVGPHLLPTIGGPPETISATMWNEGPANVIDPAIFKCKENKQKNPRKK